jgi:hypothetical protein
LGSEEFKSAANDIPGEAGMKLVDPIRMLRDPYWPRRAAKMLGEKIEPPAQYERAR